MKFCFEQPTIAVYAGCGSTKAKAARPRPQWPLEGDSVGGAAPSSAWGKMRGEVIGKGVMERRGDDGGGGGGQGRCSWPTAARASARTAAAAATAATAATSQLGSAGGASRKSGRLAESTNDGATVVSGGDNCDSHRSNVCLLCRQHVEECCLNCSRHYATATIAAATDADNSSNSSGSGRNNNNNNSKHNSRRRSSCTASKRRRSRSDSGSDDGDDNGNGSSNGGRGRCQRCQRCRQRHATATATATAATTSTPATHRATTTTAAQCNCSRCCCCSWQNYDATATTTTTVSPPFTAAAATATTTTIATATPTPTRSSQSCLTTGGESGSRCDAQWLNATPTNNERTAATSTTTSATTTECDCAHWQRYHSQSQSSSLIINNHNNNNNTAHNHRASNTSHHYPSHSATTNNRNHCNHPDHAHNFTITTPTPPPTTTTATTNVRRKGRCSAFASSLRTLQFLMIYTQMQLVRPVGKKLNKLGECITTTKLTTTTATTIATIKCKFNKRQQRPPLKRLMKIRCNSYYDNATNNFMNNDDNDEASHKQQQQQQPLLLQQLKQQFQACAQRQPHAARQRHHHPPQQQQQQHSCHRRQQSPSPPQQQQQPLLLQQQTYSRYFKMPNLSSRYKILIVLSFLSLFLPSINAQASQPTQTQLAAAANTPTVSLARNETVCKSLDIRNFPNETRQLQNCTVIEGFLLITLVNTHSIHEFNESYPLLTEVTEFIIIYRVHNLRSLAAIFPNLSIIRGRILFEGYALIVYSNPHLEELGLTKLTTISRGGVRVENNVKLCYVHTIDWSQIVTNVTDVMIVKNSNPIECQKCPGDTKNDGSSNTDLVCKATDGVHRCWNSKSCQKICPEQCRNNCIDEKTCCNDACIGGCAPANLNACTSCRQFSIFNSTCIDKCPPNYYGYLDRRCLTANECLSLRTKFENNKSERIVPYNGTCLTRCPPGYNKINSTCQKCGNKCVKKCVGGLVDSVERAKDFQGCTQIINSGLTISIKRGGRHLMEDLLDGLSSIQEITTYLKVQGTYGMLSLSYFKNLKIIRGESLYEDKFALYVLENNDLETIWAPNQTVEIREGRVFFHFNPKLCFAEIEKLRSMMYRNHSFDKNEVARDSNGHKGSCNTELLNVTIAKVSARGAVATILNPLKFEDSRTFIGYQYFHMEDKNKNATKYSQRICDDGWTVSDPTKEPKYIFFNLQPFTQYAYYVKTWTISSEPRNAQSPIKYFTTKSAQPQFVHTLNAYAISSSEIVITWTPPLVPHGNLTVYRVRAVLDKRSQVVESRNYCKDPAQIDKDEDAKDPTRDSQLAVTDQPQNAADCKCAKESSHNEIDTKESFIADRIDFENTLQNFVYVKHTKEKNSSRASDEESGASLTEMDRERRRRRRRHSEGDPQDSFLVRHMRAVPDDLENKLLSNTNDLSGDNSITTTAPLEDSTNSSINETRMDPSGKYHESIVGNVSVTTNKFVFTKLKHFSFYTVGVEACRAPEEGATNKECSDVRLQFVRTKKLDNVDKIQNLRAELEATNTTRGNVRLHWDPPEEPNGAVVSYTISFIRDSLDAVEEKKCITDLDYRNMTNGYVLSGLSAGNYSIKVRANSLAGDGVYSEPVPVDIPTTQLSTALIVVLCVVVVGLIIAGVVTYALCKKMATPSDLKIFPTVNPYYISLQYIPDEWEVSRDRVIQLSPLGQGSFGMVYEGILKGYNNSTDDTACAIKTVNENATDRERMNFLNEASVMKQFDTYHVVRLLGVCSVGQPALVVMELMKNGDLKSYLRAHRPDERDSDGTLAYMRGEAPPLQPPPLSRIYQMAIEIADGMAYLAAKKFVHRDLAARNCMVALDLTVKIGDFGMTRDIYETDYYRKGTKGLLPVRWMPPESLRDGVYSTASDVFSYGVVLWEMVTLASQPYPGYSNDQVLRFVIEGGVMERPENCPDKIYELMQQCWEHRPSKRPSFLKIIRALMDLTDNHFREVSFFHSEEGQQEREKERAEHTQNSGDVFNDNNEMDDVTTPLRMGEYNDYKLTIGNNSSVENQGDSPMAIDDDQPHSPYSLASAIGVSSTPDGQSKNSFNLSQLSHNNPTLLSSVPSTSAGIISGGSHSHSHQLPTQRFPHHGRFPTRQPGDELAAYVQPDYDGSEDHQAGGAGHSVETDERGYELYDPSPNYREHAAYDPADDEEDFDGIGFSGHGGKLSSGGQNLLPRKKPHQRMPVVMSMSSSMPDEAINAPISSSLHPSTASAASSNASSTATTTGKYPSLRKAVADTVQNVGNSLMPNRFRNRRFFNHKRSGSNASHKSTSSNPNTASSNSTTNLDKSMSGQNLGTIESGGSGSAGSYAPRFFSPSTTTTTTSTTLTSENPNYKLLDETANASCSSAVDESAATSTPTKVAAATTSMKGQRPSATAGFTTSTNPNYQLLDETLNTTLTPTKPTAGPITSTPASKPTSAAVAPYVSMTHTSDNPNYQPMEAPSLSTTSNPNYMVMSAPMPPHASSTSPIAFAHMSENPNYQMMGPQSSGHGTSASSASDDDDDDDANDHDDDHQLMEHIKMERMPLSRRRRSRSSRSRSQSQNKPDDKGQTPPATATTTGGGATLPTTSQARPAASATFSLKEKWLRQQQAQTPPPPPPNGFIGREA